MTRAVVCVATTPHYQKGMRRLAHHGDVMRAHRVVTFPELPAGWPSHQDKPYAFKAYALKAAVDAGAELVLWADAAILPIRSMEPLWEKIEREGAWIHNGGWLNHQWTADEAYPDLFNVEYAEDADNGLDPEFQNRRMNRTIPHVVATTFGLNVKHPVGAQILAEYYRLASETRAFCGPWWNSNGEREDYRQHRGAAPCGPPSTLGHRHDQTALSVIAWRLGVKLTEGAELFDYSKRRPDGYLYLQDQDQRTILLADGSMQDGVIA